MALGEAPLRGSMFSAGKVLGPPPALRVYTVCSRNQEKKNSITEWASWDWRSREWGHVCVLGMQAVFLVEGMML